MPDPTTQASNALARLWGGITCRAHCDMARLIRATEFRHAKSAGPILKALDVYQTLPPTNGVWGGDVDFLVKVVRL